MATRLFQGGLEKVLEPDVPHLAWRAGDLFTDTTVSPADIYVYTGTGWRRLGDSGPELPGHLIQELI